MHSHNRTLLAKLGFADPDKGEPRHDMACRYVTEPAQVAAILQRIGRRAPATPSPVERYASLNAPLHVDKIQRMLDMRPTSEPPASAWREEGYEAVRVAGLLCSRETHSPLSLVVTSSGLEKTITKGRGEYSTTIGFLDGRVDYAYESSVRCEGISEGGAFDRVETRRYSSSRLLVEVKIAPVDASSVLRQLHLYQEYEGGSWRYDDRETLSGTLVAQDWVVAAAFDWPRASAEMLRNHGIYVVRLGAKFDEWCASQAETVAAPVEEI